MIRALLIIWSMDPSGVGTASVSDFPSLKACHEFAGRAQIPAAYRCVAEPQFMEAATFLNYYRCDLPAHGGPVLECKGVPK